MVLASLTATHSDTVGQETPRWLGQDRRVLAPTRRACRRVACDVETGRRVVDGDAERRTQGRGGPSSKCRSGSAAAQVGLAAPGLVEVVGAAGRRRRQHTATRKRQEIVVDLGPGARTAPGDRRPRAPTTSASRPRRYRRAPAPAARRSPSRSSRPPWTSLTSRAPLVRRAHRDARAAKSYGTQADSRPLLSLQRRRQRRTRRTVPADTNDVISATMPPSSRSTSIASGRWSGAPGGRR